jgi:hypothetical protein
MSERSEFAERWIGLIAVTGQDAFGGGISLHAAHFFNIKPSTAR